MASGSGKISELDNLVNITGTTIFTAVDQGEDESGLDNFKITENSANEMAAAAKSADIPDTTVGNPDPETGEQRIVLSFGYVIVMLYWRVDTFTRYLGGFLVAPKGIFIDGNKIIE
jgi:hypothetical protein